VAAGSSGRHNPSGRKKRKKISLKKAQSEKCLGNMAVTLTSRTSAHSVTTTVAPFRAWRGSRLAVARGPVRATIEARDYHGFATQVQQPRSEKIAISQRKDNWAHIAQTNQ